MRGRDILTIVLMGALGACGGGDDDVECNRDSAPLCGAGLVCIAHHCRVPCTQDGDCQPGEACSSGGCVVLGACDQNDRCPEGLVCRKPENECVRLLLPDCLGEGPCPSKIVEWSRCYNEGALLPCLDTEDSCRDGCRVCGASGKWSECQNDLCVVGTPTSCATCTDDCTTRYLGIEVACISLNERLTCAPVGDCLDGYTDADGLTSNGCECLDCTTYYRDRDGDGYGQDGDAVCVCAPFGEYAATVGGDCDDRVKTCNLDCTTDRDRDWLRDCDDPCVDLDGDGLGDGTLGNRDCRATFNDSAPLDHFLCGDTDLDGCDDCAHGLGFDPANDGTDADGDGICSTNDCNDSRSSCLLDCDAQACL